MFSSIMQAMTCLARLRIKPRGDRTGSLNKFFWCDKTTKAVIPTMRKSGKGTIINASSVGRKVGLLPFLTAYHASKFAIKVSQNL